ncbi:unnamed protein product, partial [Lymnaea stagnalis]
MNIVVYLRLGIKDGISVCFFFLSILDLICVILLSANDGFLVGTYALPKTWPVDSATITAITTYYYTLFADMSLVTTTFVAVQRCCCVVLPFTFKCVFTRSRTFVILAALSLSCLALYLPVLTSQGLREVTDASSNVTRWVLWTSRDRGFIYSVRSVTTLIVVAACEVTVIACLFIFASSLRASVQFRDSNAKVRIGELKAENSIKHVSKPRKCLNKDLTQSLPIKTDTQNKDNCSERPGRTKPAKELQLVKATFVLSLIFVVCNAPRLAIYNALLIEPEFNVSRRYESTYMLSNVLRFTVEAVNLSSNMFVYLRFNRKYR